MDLYPARTADRVRSGGWKSGWVLDKEGAESHASTWGFIPRPQAAYMYRIDDVSTLRRARNRIQEEKGNVSRVVNN